MKIIILVSLLTFSVAAIAQDNKNANFLPHMVHGIGVSFHKFDGLNNRISGFSQFEELKNQAGTLQLGWLKEKNRIISGVGFMVGSSMSGDRDKKSSNLRFFGFNADFGYDVIGNDRILLYPFAGLGYEKYQARFYKDNSGVDFNNVLQSSEIQNNLRPVDFKNSFFTYRLGAGLALKSPRKPSHSIGLQAGYIGSFTSKEWRSSENQELLNAPEDKLERIFINLTFISQPRFMMH